MPARYAPLPNPRSGPDAEREMDDAFDDDEHHTESTPLTHGYPASQSPTEHTAPALLAIPGTYDFERDRDYDYPPPGSPPHSSIFALPNDFGNSNGRLPSSPVRPNASRPSFFRRAVGVLLPQHYSRIPTEPSHPAPRGGGTENDGVFANVMAKPGRAVPVTNESGEVFLVPEEAQKETPPTYIEAQADAVPPYWETTVHAPIGLDPGADMIVDDLPTGSVIFFVATMFISYFFQFVGFILTYLLHTSHAAKYGSRAGLGLTLIQYGFYSRSTSNDEGMTVQDLMYWNETAGMPMSVVRPTADSPWIMPSNGTYMNLSPDAFGITSRDWLSLLLMTLGWFLLLWSLIGFYRVKRWESSIRASANAAPISPEQMQRDAEVHRNLERVFGLVDQGASANENENVLRREQISEADLRLRRDLQAAGLI